MREHKPLFAIVQAESLDKSDQNVCQANIVSHINFPLMISPRFSLLQRKSLVPGPGSMKYSGYFRAVSFPSPHSPSLLPSFSEVPHFSSKTQDMKQTKESVENAYRQWIWLVRDLFRIYALVSTNRPHDHPMESWYNYWRENTKVNWILPKVCEFRALILLNQHHLNDEAKA